MPSLHVNGFDMAYAEAGSGDPVVLVHGTLLDQRYWSSQMTGLGAGYRVIAVSLRHCWPGQWNAAGPGFTIAQHVDDVAAFITALGAGPVRLIGHSRGGHIAFRVAEQHPELLRSVVLAEPGGELDATFGASPTGAPGSAPAGTGIGRQAGVFARAAELVGAGAVDDGLTVIAEHTGGPGAWARLPEARRQIARDNALTLLGQINEQRAPYSRAAAAGIQTRTLLVGGADTQPNFTAIIAALLPVIPGARAVSIPNAGHSMSLENPAAFNTAVLEFFQEG